MNAAGELYRQLVDLFHFYQYFPIDDHTGQPVSDAEMVALQYSRLTQLQRLFFKYHPSLHELALANCGTLQKRAVLKPALQALEPEELTKLVVKQLRCSTAAPCLPSRLAVPLLISRASVHAPAFLGV